MKTLPLKYAIQMVTPEEVAKILCLTLNDVWELLYMRRLSYYRFGESGQCVRILRRDVLMYVDQCRVSQIEPASE